MAMDWTNVELIRNAQSSARERFDEEHMLVNERMQEMMRSETFKQLSVPRLTEIEAMIFRMRSELIDYIVAHGLVDGLIWNGVLQPVKNGKIVITKDMVEEITRMLGYFTEDDIQAFLELYLPENHYVQDENYVHTDNNYTTEEKDKLAGIEAGAEVNKVISILFNNVETIDPETRVATITITPEDVKNWYEQNENTNAFTDAEKEKLAGISSGAEVNRVDDVLVDNRSVLNENKKAIITKEIIKQAYEANPDTNAYTDADKQQVQTNKDDIAGLKEWQTQTEETLTQLDTDIEELGNELNDTNNRVADLETLADSDLIGFTPIISTPFPMIEAASGFYYVDMTATINYSGKNKAGKPQTGTLNIPLYGIVKNTQQTPDPITATMDGNIASSLTLPVISFSISMHTGDQNVQIYNTGLTVQRYYDVEDIYIENITSANLTINKYEQIQTGGEIPEIVLGPIKTGTITTNASSAFNDFNPENGKLYFCVFTIGSITAAGVILKFDDASAYSYIDLYGDVSKTGAIGDDENAHIILFHGGLSKGDNGYYLATGNMLYYTESGGAVTMKTADWTQIQTMELSVTYYEIMNKEVE